MSFAERLVGKENLAEQLIAFKKERKVLKVRDTVFCHGDLTLDNIMITNENKFALIDWEWGCVVDSRDPWMQLKYVLEELGCEPDLWISAVNKHFTEEEMDMYQDYKDIVLTVSFIEMEKDGDIEEEYENLGMENSFFYLSNESLFVLIV